MITPVIALKRPRPQLGEYPATAAALGALRAIRGLSFADLARRAGYTNLAKGSRWFLRLEREGAATRDFIARVQRALDDAPELREAITADEHLRHDRASNYAVTQTLFARYLLVVESQGARIAREPALAWCEFPNASVSLAYVEGGGPLPLGILVAFWSRGGTSGVCDACGGATLMVSAGGSVLTGRHSISGVCRECRSYRSWQMRPPATVGGELLLPFVQLRAAMPPKPLCPTSLVDALRALCVTADPRTLPFDTSDLVDSRQAPIVGTGSGETAQPAVRRTESGGEMDACGATRVPSSVRPLPGTPPSTSSAACAPSVETPASSQAAPSPSAATSTTPPPTREPVGA